MAVKIHKLKYKKNMDPVHSPTSKATTMRPVFNRKDLIGLPFDVSNRQSIKDFILKEFGKGYYTVKIIGGQDPTLEYLLGTAPTKTDRWRERWLGVDVSDVMDFEIKRKFLG